ncbi:hypothetical protein [Bradyrhizobium sp. USDA 4350]
MNDTTMIPFNPRNWYFLATDGRVFSTAAMAEVPASDGAYSAWLGMGLTATPWPGAQTAADVRAVLEPFGYPCAPITRRQFYQQCAVAGIITQAEAIAVLANGTLPAALSTIVNALPAGQQFAAQMLLIGATEFDRNHPMVQTIGAARNMTDAQVDAFFQAAGIL